MAFWNRIVYQPQGLWVRRALFQVHLWTGIGLGLYVFTICVSGSALVFRNQLFDYFSRPPVTVDTVSPRLTDAQIIEAAEREHPGYKVDNLWPTRRTNRAVELWLTRDEDTIERLFDPYTGKDLGRAEPVMVTFLVYLASFHDDLMYQEAGRKVNGIGGLFLTITSLTGLLIWWPGIMSWRKSLAIEWRANWKRFNWTLHSAVGFWTSLIVLMFAFTGFYLVFQEPFMAIVDYFEPPVRLAGRRQLRTGDLILRWMSRAHFGRNWGWEISALWVVLGLIPPMLFVTGAIMWWNRVLGPVWRGIRRKTAVAGILPGKSFEIS
jgi:uncharacterized iron-regulated membrane protein